MIGADSSHLAEPITEWHIRASHPETDIEKPFRVTVNTKVMQTKDMVSIEKAR